MTSEKITAKRKKQKKEFIIQAICLVMAIIFTLAFLGVSINEIVKELQFDINCRDYIRLATKANSVELAMENLSVAIQYAEENGLTEGNSSVFIKMPQNNIGFWYSNMKTAYQELELISEGSTVLEKSNALMKLESISDNMPDYIWCYPNHVATTIWYLGTLIGTIVFWVIFVIIDR